jgi:hypothetical protein
MRGNIVTRMMRVSVAMQAHQGSWLWTWIHSREEAKRSEGHQVAPKPRSAKSPIWWSETPEVMLSGRSMSFSERRRWASVEREAARRALGRERVGRERGRRGCEDWN